MLIASNSEICRGIQVLYGTWVHPGCALTSISWDLRPGIGQNPEGYGNEVNFGLQRYGQDPDRLWRLEAMDAGIECRICSAMA